MMTSTRGWAAQAFWDVEQLAVIDRLVERVLAGQPTVVWVEGEPGTGKSTLLDELADRLTGFTLRRAHGAATGLGPYDVAAQWDGDLATALADATVRPFAAAQHLRQLTDRLAQAGPVCLMVDDLHWADAETGEALTWLMRRAAGDRLLVAVGSRPLSAGQLDQWRHWATTSRQVVRMRLSGLSTDAALALVTEEMPQLRADVAVRVIAHTAANPLYLRALLRERSAAELAEARMLPAPTEYVQVIGSRLAQQGVSTVALAQAIAVLGPAPVPLRAAAAVAEVTDPLTGVQPLVADDLVTVAESRGDVQATWTHALTHAAVYQQIPWLRRQALHRRAAATATDRAAALEHRIRAAGQYDDELADELEVYAAELHGTAAYRRSARALRSASGLTSDGRRRERRWLDSLYASVLAHDDHVVDTERSDVLDASDVVRRALVLGAASILRGRLSEGAAALSPVADGPPALSTDAVTRYRLETLLAWARVNLGHDTETIAAGVERAAAAGAEDPALRDKDLDTRSQLAARTGGWEDFTAQLELLPPLASATPPELTTLLGWRGSIRAVTGAPSAAITDLREVQQRLRLTSYDTSVSAIDGLLGTAYWFAGQWNLAAVCLRRAHEVPPELVHPVTWATQALHAIGTGDARVGALLEESVAVLTERAQQGAVHLMTVTMVAHRHALGSATDRTATLADLRRTWPELVSPSNLQSGLVPCHLALAMIWAGETGDALALLDKVAAERYRPAALDVVVHWLRGLVHEAAGEVDGALVDLELALGLDGSDVPLYRAHVLVDHARLQQRRSGWTPSVGASLDQAADAYRRLGAQPYLDRLRALRGAASAPAPAGPVLTLSERESDVLTLVVAGFSYAQIARDLFISQSTVSFHLGRIYAKANVSSRHDLTALVRAHPSRFATISR